MENIDEIISEFNESSLPPSDPDQDFGTEDPFFETEDEAMAAWRLRDLIAVTFSG